MVVILSDTSPTKARFINKVSVFRLIFKIPLIGGVRCHSLTGGIKPRIVVYCKQKKHVIEKKFCKAYKIRDEKEKEN
jgi:hypothetical protein